MLSRAILLILIAGSLSGCMLVKPGADRPPVQIIPDMDSQQKYKAQSENAFFADKRANRRPPAGTIAHGRFRESEVLATGKENGQDVNVLPVTMTESLLQHGRQRFNINCAPCHGRLGDGQGLVGKRGAQYGFIPSNLTQTPILEKADGHYFNVITNGWNTMQPLGQNIPEEDRWAIVAYIRALQRAANGTVGDVPADKRASLK